MKTKFWIQNAKKIILIITIACSGCSGQLVCHWQTENEQFEELIEKVIKEVKSDETT